MSEIFRSHLEFPQIVEIFRNISEAFFASENWGEYLDTQVAFWDSEDIKSPTEMVRDDMLCDELYKLYTTILNRHLQLKLKEHSRYFAAAINSSYKGDLRVKTRVFNKTLLDDILEGQVISKAQKEYICSSWNINEWSSVFNRFVDFRNLQIGETMKRMTNRFGGIYT